MTDATLDQRTDAPAPGATRHAPKVEGAGPGTIGFLLTSTLLICAIAAWCVFGTLDIVSSAVGEVVPGTKVKQVQHLEGGIIAEILVNERETVRENDILIRLDTTQIDAEVSELSARLLGLRVDVARLRAEIAGRNDPDYPDDVRRVAPARITGSLDLMETRRKRLKAEFDVQRQLIAQRQQEIQEVTARLETASTSRGFLKEQVEISESLLKRDITNRMTHINLLKDMAILDGQMKEDRAALRRMRAALAEAKARLSQIAETFEEDARKQLGEAMNELEELTERLSKFQDSQKRMVLRAPASGIVKTVAVATVGGVLKPGDVAVEIVPGDDSLVINARLPLDDIGFVQPGQNAKLTLTSADAARFGEIAGEVVGISPDALLDEEGAPYYQVRIRPSTEYFESGALRYDLYPGMRVACSILIGERTIAQYILDPYIKSMRAALRER